MPKKRHEYYPLETTLILSTVGKNPMLKIEWAHDPGTICTSTVTPELVENFSRCEIYDEDLEYLKGGKEIRIRTRYILPE